MPTLTGTSVPHMPDSPPTSETGSTYGYPELGSAGGNFSTIVDKASRSSGTAGGTTVLKYLNPFRWFGKTITYTNETRWFNDFRLARVLAADKEETEDVDTGETRERNEGGWCWSEKQVRRTQYRTLAYSEEQRYEVWTINRTQEAYFGFLTGAGGVAVDATVDGTAALQAAGATALRGMAAEAGAATLAGTQLSSAAAATAASAEVFGLVGWGFLVFQATTATWVYFSGGATNAAGDKTSEGWAIFRRVWGERERVSEELVWVMVGERRPCAPAESEGGGGIRKGEDAVPVPSGGSGDGGTITPGGRILMPGQSAMFIGLLILVVIVLLGGALFFMGGDGDTALPVAPDASASATASSPTATATEDSGGSMQQVDPPGLVIPAAGAVTSLWDALLNGELLPGGNGPSFTETQAQWANGFAEAMQQVAFGPTASSFPSDVVPSKEPDRSETTLDAVGGGFADLSDDARMRIFFNTVFPCGEGEVGFTLCPEPLGSSPGGEHLMVVAQFQGELPTLEAEAVAQYQYGFVFDSDGQSENNYHASPDFPNDFFDDTDRWYVVGYHPSSGWTLQVSQVVNGTPAAVASAARVVMLDELMVLVVPTSEFEIDDPPYRVTAFWHTGDYGRTAPHTWSGDVEPAVDVGLSSSYYGEPLLIER